MVVAEELNITRASKILMMSQPPLSNQIKSLEEELGTTLFIRGKRKLTLTEEGNYLYLRAKDIIGLADRTKNEIHDMNKGLSGTISLGIVNDTDPKLIANWIGEFYKQYPKINFHIVKGNDDDLIEKMRSGLISLAIITSPIDDVLLNSIKIKEEQFILLLNKHNPLGITKEKEIDLNELKNENLIVPSRKEHVDIIRKLFRKKKFEPNIICEVGTIHEASALIENNLGIGIYPNSTLKLNSNLVIKNIKNERAFIEYLFVWRKGHQLSLIEENFIDYIKSIYCK